MTNTSCPRCGEPMSDLYAISRTDNTTRICSGCGTAEAMEDWFDRRPASADTWVEAQMAGPIDLPTYGAVRFAYVTGRDRQYHRHTRGIPTPAMRAQWSAEFDVWAIASVLGVAP